MDSGFDSPDRPTIASRARHAQKEKERQVSVKLFKDSVQAAVMYDLNHESHRYDSEWKRLTQVIRDPFKWQNNQAVKADLEDVAVRLAYRAFRIADTFDRQTGGGKTGELSPERTPGNLQQTLSWFWPGENKGEINWEDVISTLGGLVWGAYDGFRDRHVPGGVVDRLNFNKLIDIAGEVDKAPLGEAAKAGLSGFKKPQ